MSILYADYDAIYSIVMFLQEPSLKNTICDVALVFLNEYYYQSIKFDMLQKFDTSQKCYNA
jgi:hypothetical protein